MRLENIHHVSVSHKDRSVKRIDTLRYAVQAEAMRKTPANALVLGGTGKTGSRLAAKLANRGVDARTAARRGAEVDFDWDDPTTHRAALQGIDRVYLVAPVMRTDFADQVATFLDLSQAAGVRHVTYLSAYGIDQAPAQLAPRAVELDLIGRGTITHSILRPAWFMQNFSETFLRPVDGVIAVPTANGSEAFIDVADIAAVAAETLAIPDAHAGVAYALTGPEAITVSDAAGVIAEVTGKAMRHDDIDRDAWIQLSLAAGVPADYGETLRMLTQTIASGNGSLPNDNVERVTGAPPMKFADFARRSAHAWT
jgi:uncharacterized protein YbjT (DUF2867 family)